MQEHPNKAPGSKIQDRLASSLAAMPADWAWPLDAYVKWYTQDRPFTPALLQVMRGWERACKAFAAQAPREVTVAQWRGLVEQWLEHPHRSDPSRTVLPTSVQLSASYVQRVLRFAYEPDRVPVEVAKAFRLQGLPPKKYVLMAERRAQGKVPLLGRRALPRDSLVRAEENDLRHAQAILAGLTPAWQPPLRSYLDDLMLRGKASNSMLACARAWRKGSRFFPDGSDPVKLQASDWQRMTIAWLRQPHPHDPSRILDRSTVAAQTGYIRSTLKIAYPGEELPKPVRRALGVPMGPMRLKGKVMDQAQFNALLETVQGEPEARHPHQVAEKLALLWAVWDAGGRISEVLSLNIAGVAVSPTGGVLRMHKMPRQKTGPRDIAVTESAGALMAWMEVHPASANPDAPLFCNLYSPAGMDRMAYRTADLLFRRWRERAGLPVVNGKPFRWHDLRHTRATRVAKQKWDPAMKAKHFGWSPGSAMAQLYSHIATEDILEQLRRDVGIDDQGFRAMMDAGDDLGALRHLLKKLLGNGLADATKRTPEHQRR